MSSTWGPGRRPKSGTNDPAVIHRLIAGDHTVSPTTGELHAAIDHLDQHGASASYVAERIGTTYRTVQRRRAQRRAAA